MLNIIPDYSKESLGSEEESGKDWDELEEEARKGKFFCFIFWGTNFSILRYYLPDKSNIRTV